eukprot:4361024-Pyramimonas_sp.AAC.1
MPHGRVRRGSPLRSRWTGSPVSTRSGASAMSEGDMPQTALMVNADGQNAARANEDTFENAPLTQQCPYRYDEYPTDWTPSNIKSLRKNAERI